MENVGQSMVTYWWKWLADGISMGAVHCGLFMGPKGGPEAEYR
jgi:hypothetical protein